MGPEGDEVDKGLPVTLNNIEHRVESEQKLYFLRHYRGVPEDRGAPEAELQNDIDNLAGVPGKDIYGRRNPAYPQCENAHSSKIIQCLEPIQTEGHAMQQYQGCQHEQENRMGDK